MDALRCSRIIGKIVPRGLCTLASVFRLARTLSVESPVERLSACLSQCLLHETLSRYGPLPSRVRYLSALLAAIKNHEIGLSKRSDQRGAIVTV